MSFVAAGLGVSLVPASVRNMTVEGAVYRPLVHDATRVELAAAWRRDDQRPVLVRALDPQDRPDAPADADAARSHAAAASVQSRGAKAESARRA